MTLDAVLGVLPFLPPGRGALILILGGLVMLPVSLLMSRSGTRAPREEAALEFVPLPSHAPLLPPTHPAQPAWRDAAAQPVWLDAPVAPRGSRPWAGTGIERAIRKAVGWTQLVAAEPGHYVVRLGRCDSCARGLRSCERERAAIEHALAPYLLAPRVQESVCGRRARGTCTFDIRGR